MGEGCDEFEEMRLAFGDVRVRSARYGLSNYERVQPVRVRLEL